jgi:KDO2-lipid IV(A) lauroyltransferase
MAKKSGFTQHLIWRLETLGYDAVRFILSPLSFDRISALGGWILRKIGPMTRKQSIARTGIKIAFPDMSEADVKRLLNDQWDNLGRTFAEFLFVNRVKVFTQNSRVTVHGGEYLTALKKSGESAVFFSGHFANWEIMSAVVSQSVLPIQITYRPLNNPYLDKRVRSQRLAYGTKLLIPKSGAKGARQLIEALKSGDSVALMNDQKFNQGISVPFFGTDAMTAPGPARLALKLGVPFIPLTVTRKQARFQVTIHPPLDIPRTGQNARDVKQAVKQVNAFIEKQICLNPNQWFWVHRRWPKEHYTHKRK